MRVCDICRKDMPYDEKTAYKVVMYEKGNNYPMDICPECQNKIWVYARKTLKEQSND